MTRALLPLALFTFACAKGTEQASDTTRTASTLHTVSGARIAFPHAGPPGEWQMPAGDYSNSRYSELATITPANAANLRVSWTFSTGVLRGHEGQPLSVGLLAAVLVLVFVLVVVVRQRRGGRVVAHAGGGRCGGIGREGGKGEQRGDQAG